MWLPTSELRSSGGHYPSTSRGPDSSSAWWPYLGRLTAAPCRAGAGSAGSLSHQDSLLRNHIWKVAGKRWRLLSETSAMNRSLVGSVPWQSTDRRRWLRDHLWGSRSCQRVLQEESYTQRALVAPRGTFKANLPCLHFLPPCPGNTILGVPWVLS